MFSVSLSSFATKTSSNHSSADAPLFSITRHPGFGFPVVEGRPLSLRCEIDSNPPSVAKWERDADPAISGPDVQLEPVETNFDGTLNFTSISKNDIGWYRCTTQHEFGFFASFGYFLNVRSECKLCCCCCCLLCSLTHFFFSLSRTWRTSGHAQWFESTHCRRQ